MTNSNTASTYNLKTRFGVNEQFRSLVAAKQWMVERGFGLDWERYDDNTGTYWLGFDNAGIDAVAEIR